MRQTLPDTDPPREATTLQVGTATIDAPSRYSVPLKPCCREVLVGEDCDCATFLRGSRW